MEDTKEQSDNNRERNYWLKPYQFKKGQSGNPHGRPVGTVSMKEYAKKMLASMNDEERQEFMNGLSKDIIWEMAEGKAQNNSDITSAGQPISVNLIKYEDNNDSPSIQAK